MPAAAATASVSAASACGVMVVAGSVGAAASLSSGFCRCGRRSTCGASPESMLSPTAGADWPA